MPASTQKKTSPRTRHVPQRTCISCRQVRPKRELIRIVRSEEGSVQVDPTGKKSGRGAYLCRSKGCWEAALKKEHLARALKAKPTPDEKQALAQYADTLS
ncbi:MAG: YlxR family protein [Chloroflexota bacterium]|nr:YlxR family protein [Chloroflexota bacterium]